MVRIIEISISSLYISIDIRAIQDLDQGGGQIGQFKNVEGAKSSEL